MTSMAPIAPGCAQSLGYDRLPLVGHCKIAEEGAIVASWLAVRGPGPSPPDPLPRAPGGRQMGNPAVIDDKKMGNVMNIRKITLCCGLVASLLVSACGTTSGPTKLDVDRWKIVDKNYLEAAKEANAHCKSLGQNKLKVISRKAGEDSVEVIYQCAKE